MSLVVRPLTDADLDWAADLYAANQRDALTEDERAGGFVQGQLTRVAIGERFHSRIGSLAAELDGHPVGVLLTSEAGNFSAGPPALVQQVAQDAGLDDVLLYGPVVVAREARGQGVLRALADAAVEAATGHYRHLVAFVEEANEASSAAHARLGFRPVGGFEWQQRKYAVIARDLP